MTGMRPQVQGRFILTMLKEWEGFAHVWQGYLVNELKILERQSAESSCLWRRSRWVGQKMEQYSLDPSFGYYEAAMVVLRLLRSSYSSFSLKAADSKSRFEP